MINGFYEPAEVNTAISGLGPELMAKVKSALNFSFKLKAIKNNDDWATVTNNGKNLWMTIAPEAIYVSCGSIGKDYKYGRLPSEKKVYGCTDNTIIMAGVYFFEENQGIEYPIPCSDIGLDSQFLNAFFTKLSTVASVLPSQSDLLQSIGISEFDSTSWKVDSAVYNDTKTRFNAILQHATEQAYAGIITKVPEGFDKIVSTCEWLDKLDLDAVYTIPNKADGSQQTLTEYIEYVKQCLELAMIEMLKDTGNFLTPTELQYLNVSKEVQPVNINAISSSVSIANSQGQPIAEGQIQLTDVPIDSSVNAEVGATMNSSVSSEVMGTVVIPTTPIESAKVEAAEIAKPIDQFITENKPETPLTDVAQEALDILYPNTVTDQPAILGRDSAFVPQVPVPGVNEAIPMVGVPDVPAKDSAAVEPSVPATTVDLTSMQPIRIQATVPAEVANSVQVEDVTGLIQPAPMPDHIPDPGFIKPQPTPLVSGNAPTAETILEVGQEMANETIKSLGTPPQVAQEYAKESYPASENSESETVQLTLDSMKFTEVVDTQPLESSIEQAAATGTPLQFADGSQAMVSVEPSKPETVNVQANNQSLGLKAMPISQNRISIDPVTHKVTVSSEPVQVTSEQSAATPTSPEAIAHATNPHMEEVNKFAAELESMVSLDVFKESV